MGKAAVKAIALGGSAGSLASLFVILQALPADYRPALFVAVHVPPDAKKSVLVSVLQAYSHLAIREVEDKEPIHGNTVYVAPANYHLLVETPSSLALSNDEPVQFSRPSIDVLFESAADAYGDALAGVVLSGANRDGASGLKTIHDAGGLVMVEDPANAYASAMPQAALAACPQAQIGSPQQIASYLKLL